MKNTARLILAAIAVAAALVSCTKDLNPGKADTGSEAGTLRTITVSFDTSTKSYLDGLKPHFSEGDSILVLGMIPSGDNLQTVYDTCIVSVKNGIATITTEFTGILDAYYPLASTKIEPGVLYQFVPPMQTGRFDDANICSAKIGKGGTMAIFENNFPILRFYAGAGIGVDTIRIKSSKVLAGLRDVSDTTVITVTPPKLDANAIVAQEAALSEEGKPVQDPRIWYAAIAGGHNANDLTFESVTTTQGTVEKAPTTDLQLVKGKIYNAFIPYYITVAGDKWAYCNVGAFLPEEPGEYFMWGYTVGHTANTTGTDAFSGQTFKQDETRGDDSEGFAWDNYIKFTSSTYYSPTNTTVFTKYVPLDKAATYGDGGTFSDDKTTLDLADDAANANWGGGWRMPTKAEFDALSGGSWDVSNKGYTFGTSHKIFLPAVDCGDGVNLENVGVYGYYWSSSLNTDDSGPYYAYCFNFFSDEADTFISYRCYGMPVRPIYDETLSEDQPAIVTINAYTDGGTL